MRRGALPAVSVGGKAALDRYEQALRSEEDLSAVTIRNYLSDLRQFAAWWEGRSQEEQEEASPFTPTAVATPTLTAYRSYLQHTLRLKPASVNRSLVSLKRYFAWLTETGQIKHNPAKVVKLVEQEVPPPRHLSDQEEQALEVYDPFLRKHTDDPRPLFLSEKTHRRLTERGLGYLIKKYAQRAKVYNVSPHDLRHRFGYRMAESVPLHRLAQLMGHDSLDTTMIYIRATRSDLQKDVEKIAWV